MPLKSPLDGNELMELFGRGPGPWLRPIKDHLLSLVIDGMLSPDDKEEAAKIARKSWLPPAGTAGTKWAASSSAAGKTIARCANG